MFHLSCQNKTSRLYVLQVFSVFSFKASWVICRLAKAALFALKKKKSNFHEKLFPSSIVAF